MDFVDLPMLEMYLIAKYITFQIDLRSKIAKSTKKTKEKQIINK